MLDKIKRVEVKEEPTRGDRNKLRQKGLLKKEKKSRTKAESRNILSKEPNGETR